MDVKNLEKHAPGIKKYISQAHNTYAQALCAAVDFLRAKKKSCGGGFDPSRKYILFVPDKYTLLAEKVLYGDGSGSFDSEVLTINRLCFRMIETMGVNSCEKPLSRLGAILCVRKIMSENEDKLGCFKSSARYPGFGEVMYDNINQLAACSVDADDLPDGEEGILGEKLKAIKFVYSEFQKLTHGKRYVDASGRMRLLKSMLDNDGGYFDNSTVAFACFDDFTPLAAGIVKKICDLCGKGNARITNTSCSLRIENAAIEEYAATSQSDALKAAALRIRNLAISGEAYDDMGVIACGVDNNRLKRIFAEYGVPYFTDEKYALSSHPLARYVSDMFGAAKSGSNENYIRLSKNPYSGIDRDAADAFENCIYTLSMGEWAVNKKFELSCTYDKSVAAMLDTAEKVRAHLHARVRRINKSEIRSGEDFVRAVENIMPDNESEISVQYDKKFPAARTEIMSAVAVISEIFGTGADFDVMLSVLKECFELKEVGVIPNSSDTVEVGDVSTFRASGKKYLFVLGMHDGELPAVKYDDGILSDADIARISVNSAGRAGVEPSIETLNNRADEELRSVLSSSENLFLSFVTDCAPSPLLIQIRKLRKGTEKWSASSLEDARERLTADGKLNAQALYELCPTEASALELYLVGRDDIDAGGDGYGFETELKVLLGDKIPELTVRKDTVTDAHGLYYSKRMSVSRVQEYFACPLRHFFRYGLKAKKRADGSVSPLDLGTFLHRVIELFIAGKDYSHPEKAVPEIVKKIERDEPYTVKGISPAFLHELTDEAVKLSSVAAEQLDRGSYRAEFTEADFGKHNSLLEGPEVELSGGVVTVEGVIDRIDVADTGAGGKGLARVIDYKTGHAGFDLRDVYYGRKIQLPIYLKVAEKNGYIPAGMFYFPFSSGFVEDEKSYRLRGIFDAAYARETDGRLCEPDVASDVVAARSAKNSSADGVVLSRVSPSAVSREKLTAVCDYALRIFKKGAEEAFSGYCAPSPLVSGRASECTYCEMKPACVAFGGEKKERRKRRLPSELFERIGIAEEEEL